MCPVKRRHLESSSGDRTALQGELRNWRCPKQPSVSDCIKSIMNWLIKMIAKRSSSASSLAWRWSANPTCSGTNSAWRATDVRLAHSASPGEVHRNVTSPMFDQEWFWKILEQPRASLESESDRDVCIKLSRRAFLGFEISLEIIILTWSYYRHIVSPGSVGQVAAVCVAK